MTIVKKSFCNILLFICLVFPSIGLAQDIRVPDSCSAFLPNVLVKSQGLSYSIDTVLNAENKWGQLDSCSHKYWIVYSNDNHQTFSEPSSFSQVIGNIKISEKLRVAQVVDDYALVYNEKSPRSVTYPQISGKSEIKGWVPMSNLLLWTSCPTDSTGNVHKAFINKDNLSLLLSKIGTLCHYSKTSSNGLDMYSFFVFQENGDSVLLSRSQSLTGKHEDEIIGWINRNLIYPWNNRLCLEPIWDTDSVTALKQSNLGVSLYGDPELARPIVEFHYPASEPKNGYRLPPNVLRFPVILESEVDSAIYKIIVPQKYQRVFDNVEYVAGDLAYTPKEDNNNHMLWQQVLMISASELSESINRLHPVIEFINNATGDISERQQLVNLCKSIGDVFGKGETVSKDILSVLDTDFISTEDFVARMHKYRDKCDNLSRFTRNSYKYVCNVDGIKYYFIPIDILP